MRYKEVIIVDKLVEYLDRQANQCLQYYTQGYIQNSSEYTFQEYRAVKVDQI